jgi:hypothetical protein
MSLQAFTQQPGSHSRYEDEPEYGWGKWFGWEGTELLGFSSGEVERSDKHYPTPSDHVRPTDYGRGVAKLITNRPSVIHRYAEEGNPPNNYVVIDYYHDDHITNHHPFRSYVVADPGYENALDKSVDDALNKLTGAYAGLGADLGQTRKTCDEFAHMAGRFASGLLALKRGNFRLMARNLLGMKGKDLKALQGSIANLWLEYIYGIKPLMNDIYQAQLIVHEELKKNLHIFGHGSGVSGGGSLDDFHANGFIHNGSAYSTHHTRLGAWVVNPDLYRLNQAGLINPLSIAWELVPWSFAIDWFVPIGQTLQAITAGVGLQSDGGYTSSRLYDSLEITAEIGPPGWDAHVIDGGYYHEMGFAFNRLAYASFPLPRLYADVTPYSTVRAVNALALVRQLV